MTATPDRVGLGVVGAGAFAQFLVESVADLPGVVVAAVADQDADRARALAHKHGAAVAANWPTLLSDGAVDVVVVTTPPSLHAQIALAALAAGRHVFCEKPLATTAADAARVREIAATSPGRLVVDHVLRYSPVLRLLGSLRRAGVLGAVRRFTFDNDAEDENLHPEHWFWDEAISGGILVEHGVHFFDACAELLGSLPEAIQAIEGRRPDGRVDTVVATTRHPGGALATFAHGFSHVHRCERQLMRVDFGWAEARVHGWIPVRAELDVWTDDAGQDALAELAADAARALAVPGMRPSGRERIDLTPLDSGTDAMTDASGLRPGSRQHARVVVDLGGEAAKPRAYAEAIRAAMHDLLDCIGTGRRPVADADAGWSSVVVAAAGRQAAAEQRTVSLSWPADRELPASVPMGVSP